MDQGDNTVVSHRQNT